MAKVKKETPAKKRGNYDKPLKVKGNIFQVLKASMDDADKKSAQKKSNQK